ncbi:hypothetical protein A2U01_0057727, partial [Trifolium medium]|nr:hypothetical protein [Trifolium medium]
VNVLVAAASQTKDDIGSVVDKPKQTVPEKDVVPHMWTNLRLMLLLSRNLFKKLLW